MKDEKVQLLEPKIEITLRTKPENNNFKRFLLFRDYEGNRVRFPVKFKKKKGLTYQSSEWPEGFELMQKFLDEGNRSFWDEIWLENRKGKTALDVGHVQMKLTIKGIGKSGKRSIEFINHDVNRVLEAGSTKINLNPAAIATRYRRARMKFEAPPVVRAALRDLGKYGTDAVNGTPQNENPKFGPSVKQGGPEFVAWYYHDEKVKVGKNVFDRPSAGDDLVAHFRSISRLGSWQKSKSGFYNTKTRKKVEPKAGDYLHDRREGGHAMLIVSWNPRRKMMRVLTGPKPVTLKRIDFSKLDADASYWLGSI